MRYVYVTQITWYFLTQNLHQLLYIPSLWLGLQLVSLHIHTYPQVVGLVIV